MLKVFWRYDFILHIKVDHPYISEISYQMNFKTTVLRVPQRKFMYKRSLEMNGIYKGKDIAELAKRMEEMAGTESGAIKRDNVVEAFLVKQGGCDLYGIQNAGDKRTVRTTCG